MVSVRASNSGTMSSASTASMSSVRTIPSQSYSPPSSSPSPSSNSSILQRIRTKTFRLLCMLALSSTFMFVELLVGHVTNSTALVADAFHMLSDVISICVGLLSVRMSRRQQSSLNTYGWARSEVVGALVNAVFLEALCFTIAVEAITKLIHVEKIRDPYLLLYVGITGLVINLFALFLFHDGHGHSHGGHGHSHHHSHTAGHMPANNGQYSDKVDLDSVPAMKTSITQSEEYVTNVEIQLPTMDKGTPANTVGVVSSSNNDVKLNRPFSSNNNWIPFFKGNKVSSSTNKKSPKKAEKKKKERTSQQMNMHAVFLHVLGDALGSVVVILSAVLVIQAEGDWRYYMDPLLSLVIVAILLCTTTPLLKSSSMVLLQCVPSHINVDVLRTSLLRDVVEVESIQQLHVWQLAGEKAVATVEACVSRGKYEHESVVGHIKAILRGAGITNTTVELVLVEDQLKHNIYADIIGNYSYLHDSTRHLPSHIS